MKMSRLTLLAMTVATGLCVGNLYYCQPLLGQMHQSLGGSERDLAWIPTLTQVGYALGMLFIVPMGDLFEKRRLIVLFTLLSALALLGVASSPNLWIAALASLVLGLSTMTPQLIVPFAAHLAPEKQRGQVVGTVMSGLLLGILLARTVAGFLGSFLGWRFQFGLMAGLLVICALVLQKVLPRSETSFRGSYLDLLKSVFEIFRSQPTLREAALFGACFFAAFSCFWATLIHLMESPAFHLGAKSVGTFGLLGAAGALGAPFIGKFVDRKNPRATVGVSLLVTILAFVIYWVWGGTSLTALAIGVLLMDVGVQSGHIANQSRIFALIPEARSRINTAYMFFYFLGGAAGSWLASYAWTLFGWPGVCGAALSFLGVSSLVYFAPRRQ